MINIKKRKETTTCILLKIMIANKSNAFKIPLIRVSFMSTINVAGIYVIVIKTIKKKKI